MLAELLYFVSIASFGFVILGAAQLPSGTGLVIAIFPVFIAMIVGFVMWVYAWSEFGPVVSVGSLVAPIAAVWATVVVGLVCARFAFLAADIG